MDKKLISILTCPKTDKPLKLHSSGNALVCTDEDIAYPIVDGIPHLTTDAAITISKIPQHENSIKKNKGK
ncbi:MAG: Trm112 family protein [Burkholderiaceae bacterium]|nr:MAG: hypothetical protein CBC60_01840 [Betaproteobacteria bacterium TMED100]|tara:strand:+ start:104 stop:313 length:210 start_codon:yes stop_codon:yes gene_type:complete